MLTSDDKKINPTPLQMIGPCSHGKNIVKTFLLGPNRQSYSQSV
jgi:hypothetical protein